MSAPPDARPPRDMSAPPPAPATVRHIPIFVEGRDEPVISRAAADHAPHPPQPPQAAPHVDRDAYFADDAGASFHHPPNFSRTFGTPSGKAFRAGPQPFMQQKAYPQAAFARGASPQRSQSPRPPPAHPAAPHQEYVKVPVHHEQAPPRAPAHHPPPPAPPQRDPTPPPPPKPVNNDPITQILSIQTDVLNLMTEVENFAGTKKDKRYLFLDEMLTRNLIKLDNIETEGKENIRLARKEAIRCIQKCIAVLEAKAEKNSCSQPSTDVDMNEPVSAEPAPADTEVEMKDEHTQPRAESVEPQPASDVPNPPTEAQPQEETPQKPEESAQENQQAPEAAPSSEAQPQEQPKPSEENPQEKTEEVQDNPKSPKKKVVKKRDKSKDKAPADSAEVAKDSDKEVMQVDNKGDRTDQVMEVDGAASQ